MTPAESKYCDQVEIAEQLWEFHQDAFDVLDSRTMNAVIRYFGLDQNTDNILSYMHEIIAHNPEISKIAVFGMRKITRDLRYKTAVFD